MITFKASSSNFQQLWYPAFNTWVKNLIVDEAAIHFGNMIKIFKDIYTVQLGKAEDIYCS
ncbi:MAG: hypothetical protein DMENIID0002_08690 [Rickettsia endosymbiont of Sergentomyia squamirostris]|uniref:Uncharacterized protein n=1 Tax=Candidatus Tisiphia endosymbiont of Sergentomyia squamirostris TaxID=3113639 RepID=A0AAT9G8R1_9RICK